MGSQQILWYFSHQKLELVGSGSEINNYGDPDPANNFGSERIRIHNTVNYNYGRYRTGYLPVQLQLSGPVFRIRIRFLRIWIQGFFLNPDPIRFRIRIQVKKKHLERQFKKFWGFLPVWYLFTCIFEFALQNGCQISTCMIKKHITVNW